MYFQSAFFLLSVLSLFRCSSISFVVFVTRATSSANLRFYNLSPSMFIPLSRSAFLNISSTTAVNNFGDIGSHCRTPYPIANGYETWLSRRTLAVATLYIFSKIFTYVSFTFIFLNASNMLEWSMESKAFT